MCMMLAEVRDDVVDEPTQAQDTNLDAFHSPPPPRGLPYQRTGANASTWQWALRVLPGYPGEVPHGALPPEWLPQPAAAR